MGTVESKTATFVVAVIFRNNNAEAQ